MRLPIDRILSRSHSGLILILLVVLSRLIPHPPNFSPVLSIALFSGVMYSRGMITRLWWALAIPFLGMVLSNWVLGFHVISWVVVGLISGLTLLGLLMGRQTAHRGNTRQMPGARAWLTYSLLSACLFFVFSNFFVWLLSGYYPATGDGLVACYVAAIPFFQHTLASVVVYSAVLFEGQRWMDWLVDKAASSPSPA